MISDVFSSFECAGKIFFIVCALKCSDGNGFINFSRYSTGRVFSIHLVASSGERMGSDGPICHFRLTGAESSYCLLKTRRMADAENAIPSLVFHGADETRPVLCGPELAAVCPFRSAGSDHPSRKAMVMCPHCGHRHRPDSNSRQICEAWASTKQVLKQMRTEFPGLRKYYIVGTKQLPYAEDTTDLVRRVLWPKIKSAVLRRDKNICQDCGVSFEKGRIKVFDPTLRRAPPRASGRWFGSLGR